MKCYQEILLLLSNPESNTSILCPNLQREHCKTAPRHHGRGTPRVNPDTFMTLTEMDVGGRRFRGSAAGKPKTYGPIRNLNCLPATRAFSPETVPISQSAVLGTDLLTPRFTSPTPDLSLPQCHLSLGYPSIF